MNLYKNRPFFLLIIIQSFLIGFVFPKHFSEPLETIFCTWGDAIKNYFTSQSFINSKVPQEGLFKFNEFAYPFGDYAWYTDNTPIFSLAYKWFCIHVADITAFQTPIFNWIIIANIMLCSIIMFLIFKKLHFDSYLSILLSVVLSWCNPQILRLYFGHANLSLSSLIAFSILLFIFWTQQKENLRNKLFISAIICIYCVFSFTIHGYYMAIVTIFISCMLIFYSLFSEQKKANVIISIAIPLVTLGIILTLLKVTDAYLYLRNDLNKGYDWIELKTNFSRFFAPYKHQSFYFPLSATKNYEATELNIYLGNIGLYSLSLLVIGCLFFKNLRKKVWQIQVDFFQNKILRSIFLAGIVLLIISFGEVYHFQKDAFQLVWPFNLNNGTPRLTIIIWAVFICTIAFSVLFYKSEYKKRPFRLKEITLLAVVLGLLTLLFFNDFEIKVTNILNPFFYIHFISNKVEQFRCLGRFNWPFYFTFYIWIGYTINALLLQSTVQLKLVFLVVLSLIGALEIWDNIKFFKLKCNKPNPYSTLQLQKLKPIIVNPSQYQAIIPLPIFMVGSDNLDLTIDDNDDFSTYAMQLSLKYKLPLMACKMARTPPIFSEILLNYVAKDIKDPQLKAALNHKPILIVVNKGLLNDTNASHVPKIDNMPKSRILYFKTMNFIARHHLVPFDSSEGNYFYKTNNF